MEAQKIQLRKYSGKLTVKQVADLSVRAKTLGQMWNSSEPSFIKIIRTSGEKMVRSLLVIEVGRMVELLKADMQKVQIEYMVDYILQHYNSYTISDLTVITDKLVRNNPYGKPILQNFIYELDQYSIERQEYAVQENIKKSAEYKKPPSDSKAYEYILKKYEAMKKQEPKISQEEKDKRAIEANKERIKALELAYPKK